MKLNFRVEYYFKSSKSKCTVNSKHLGVTKMLLLNNEYKKACQKQLAFSGTYHCV